MLGGRGVEIGGEIVGLGLGVREGESSVWKGGRVVFF
jgi:hypothetical protein